nr:uncharacterized protein LOC113813596 isoform X1 [Penaeus vannamei]
MPKRGGQRDSMEREMTRSAKKIMVLLATLVIATEGKVCKIATVAAGEESPPYPLPDEGSTELHILVLDTQTFSQIFLEEECLVELVGTGQTSQNCSIYRPAVQGLNILRFTRLGNTLRIRERKDSELYFLHDKNVTNGARNLHVRPRHRDLKVAYSCSMACPLVRYGANEKSADYLLKERGYTELMIHTINNAQGRTRISLGDKCLVEILHHHASQRGSCYTHSTTKETVTIAFKRVNDSVHVRLPEEEELRYFTAVSPALFQARLNMQVWGHSVITSYSYGEKGKHDCGHRRLQQPSSGHRSPQRPSSGRENPQQPLPDRSPPVSPIAPEPNAAGRTVNVVWIASGCAAAVFALLVTALTLFCRQHRARGLATAAQGKGHDQGKYN